MKSKQKFFVCKHCGNMVGVINDKGVSMICCGEKMSELVPNVIDASAEKHVPFVTVSKDTVNVKVGSVPHPMEDKHNITFVYIETEHGGQRKAIKPGEKPEVTFKLVDDKPIAAFAYCNLHGLWKTEL